MIKNIFLGILIILLVVFQVGFINEFTSASKFINLVLVTLIFLTFLSDSKVPIAYIIVTGLILDIFSLYMFGLYTVSLLLTSILIKYLQRKYINQKTYYSLIIISLVGTLFYLLLNVIGVNFAYLLNTNPYSLSLNTTLLFHLVLQFLFNAFILIFLLFVYKIYNNKFKSKIYLKS